MEYSFIYRLVFHAGVFVFYNKVNIYFSGKNPNFTPKYKIKNLTPFRQEVTDIMNSIEYGEVVTYKDISKIIDEKRGIKIMSSQAVGGAIEVDIYNFFTS